MPYYHITAPENFKKILKEGIKANEGQIWLFDCEDMRHPYEENEILCVPELIAQNQCFLDKYFVIEIDEAGITGELIPDNVGELTSSAQWILKQELIDLKFIIDSWDESYYR